MRSRIAVVLALSVGFILSTTGIGLAVSALSNTDNASVSQYGPDQSACPGSADCPQVLGDQSGEDPVQPGDLQAAGQAAVQIEEGSLPFTGFVAIPVLIVGIVLLVSGMALRRRRVEPGS